LFSWSSSNSYSKSSSSSPLLITALFISYITTISAEIFCHWCACQWLIFSYKFLFQSASRINIWDYLDAQLWYLHIGINRIVFPTLVCMISIWYSFYNSILLVAIHDSLVNISAYHSLMSGNYSFTLTNFLNSPPLAFLFSASQFASAFITSFQQFICYWNSDNNLVNQIHIYMIFLLKKTNCIQTIWAL
jgi:hypothetical protein